MVELQHLQYGKLLKHMTFSAAIPLVMFNARLQGLHCCRQPLSSKLSVFHFSCMMTDPGSADVITKLITLKSHPLFPSVLLNFALRLRAINEICVHYYTQCSLSLLSCTQLSLNCFIHITQIILHAYGFISAQVIIKPKRCKLIYSSLFNLQFFSLLTSVLLPTVCPQLQLDIPHFALSCGVLTCSYLPQFSM